MKIGFIGLGIMGSRMAMNLVEAGFEMIVYNRDQEKTKALKSKGARVSKSVGKLVSEADIFITMLSTPKVIADMANGDAGFLQSANTGKLWINTSTVNPSFAARLAKDAEASGIAYLDAPVAGTKAPAEAGELVFFVGGPENHIVRAHPLLDVMGKKTIPLGEVGSGSKMKMLVNALLAQSMRAFAETVKLGERSGLAKELLLNILPSLPVVAPFLSQVKPKLESMEFEPNFPLQWMQKDLHLAAVTAYEYDHPMPLLNVAKEIFQSANHFGLGTEDFSAVYKIL
ncbi:MAG: NAD(P)-dependent oxidoreductase [Cyclobacteriaceae bacterium]|nr:NAD(P)-dependent oxidoreductase [Cyclobacteriaceae bacterium HetDA_MAG_MS6]